MTQTIYLEVQYDAEADSLDYKIRLVSLENEPNKLSRSGVASLLRAVARKEDSDAASRNEGP